MDKSLREAWLNQAVIYLIPLFQRIGLAVPMVRVSVGFPSTGIRSRHIGQCWSTSASEDGVNQIFIAPQESDPVKVLDTLTHELVHAVDDCKHGHGKEFKEIATAIGLKGPMRSASAGERLLQELEKIAHLLGSYPHKKLHVSYGSMKSEVKRPGAICSKCGYEVVMLKKHLQKGTPFCPVDHFQMDPVGDWDLVN